MLRIRLVKSPIGNVPKNRATVRALGLKKLQQEVVLPDNAAIRGMVHQVKHLVTMVEDPDATPTVKPQPKHRRAKEQSDV